MGKKANPLLKPKKIGEFRGQTCAYCGKQCFSSRKLARDAAKARHPGHHLSAYQCKDAPEYVDLGKHWHFGHLSTRVVEGKKPRYEVGGKEKLVRENEPRRAIPADIRATIRKTSTPEETGQTRTSD